MSEELQSPTAEDIRLLLLHDTFVSGKSDRGVILNRMRNGWTVYALPETGKVRYWASGDGRWRESFTLTAESMLSWFDSHGKNATLHTGWCWSELMADAKKWDAERAQAKTEGGTPVLEPGLPAATQFLTQEAPVVADPVVERLDTIIELLKPKDEKEKTVKLSYLTSGAKPNVTVPSNAQLPNNSSGFTAAAYFKIPNAQYLKDLPYGTILIDGSDAEAVWAWRKSDEQDDDDTWTPSMGDGHVRPSDSLWNWLGDTGLYLVWHPRWTH